MSATRSNSHCSAIIFKFVSDDEYYDDYIDEEILKRAVKTIKSSRIDIRIGDIVLISPEEEDVPDSCEFFLDKESPFYRNENIYLWNGKKLLELDFKLEEYGALPKRFLTATVDDPNYSSTFPIGYWHSEEALSIAHNSYIWIDIKSIRNLLLQNLNTGKAGTSPFIKPSKDWYLHDVICYTWYHSYNDKRIYICYRDDALTESKRNTDYASILLKKFMKIIRKSRRLALELITVNPGQIDDNCDHVLLLTKD